MNNDYEELFRELNLKINDNNQQHDMATLLGSLGVSPKYMNMYMDSIKKINEFKVARKGGMIGLNYHVPTGGHNENNRGTRT
ncbi:hypothetical protein [Paenibacillus lactis]|uniref:hypothetical protein n=1 Tax=Paenibacillus lactis TaxID=228574 RepID=UPI003D73D252